jgi:peptidoglycan/LPS O-acetylase OafA/YrhL
MKRLVPFRSLDALRGLAALWVVMDHSCDRFIGGANAHFVHFPLYAISLRGQLGVLIFFLISGYCITSAAYTALARGKSLSRFAYERIRRIYPPYLAACAVGVIVTFLLNFSIRHHLIAQLNHPQVTGQGMSYWIANILLVQIEANQPMLNIVFWSLCYEISFYFIVGIFLFLAQRIARSKDHDIAVHFFCGIIGALTLVSLVWNIWFSSTCPFPIDRWYQFGLGALCLMLFELRPINALASKGFWATIKIEAGLAIGLLCVLSYLGGTQGDIGHPSIRTQAISTLVMVALFSLLWPIDKKIGEHALSRPLFWLGSFSYSLYLVHPIILPFIDAPMRHMGFDGNRYIVTFVIQVFIAIAFGRLFYLLVEQFFISSRQQKRISEELHHR